MIVFRHPLVRHRLPLLIALSVSCFSHSAYSQQAVSDAAIDRCLQQRVLEPLNQHATIAELRTQCESELSTTDESGNQTPLRFFRPYKDNYLVFGRMEMDNNSKPFSGETLDTKFELGLTFSLFEGRRDFQFLAPLHVGYSQKSWWNIAEDSAPFSEHNYNPEIYWLFNQPDRPLLGKFPFVDVVGFEHQSNGQAGIFSRSWDRSYVQKEFYLLPQLSVGLKVWNILRKDLTNDDIRDYLGNGMLSIMFQPNDRTNLRWRLMRGSKVETWSYVFDIYYRRPNVNGAFFIQYQDGYGEAMISYNQKSKSLRAGFYFPLDIFD
jgi:phospholipase A1